MQGVSLFKLLRPYFEGCILENDGLRGPQARHTFCFRALMRGVAQVIPPFKSFVAFAIAGLPRKLSQISGTVTLPQPIAEYPPGVGSGVVGGAIGGVVGGVNAGEGAALGSLAAIPANNPAGEEIVQYVPTPVASAAGGYYGAEQGAVYGSALGAAFTMAPQGEQVTLAPQVEVPAPVAGAIIGSNVGAAVGGATGEAVTAYLLNGPAGETAPMME
jgi:hypothetical protein